MIEEIEEKMEIGGEKGAEFRVIGAKNGSEIVEEVAEIDADADGDEAEGKVQFLVDLEPPEVILNFYIINKIAKLLDFQDLKSLRQVNNLWCEGATPTFVQNAAFSLNIWEQSVKKLKAFGQETKDLDGVKALKMSRSYSSYLEVFKKEAELFSDIVSALAPTLTELKLVRWKDDVILSPGAPIQLPALTKITFKDCYFDRETGLRLLQTLNAAAPNVALFVAANVTPNFLWTLLDDPNNESRASKLKCLSMRARRSNLWSLLRFPQTFENLEISISVKGNNDLGNFNRLLEKNSDALVELKLEIEDMRKYSLLNWQRLRFPEMLSKLEKLEFDFGFLSTWLSIEGRGLNFSETMPKLSSFSVKLPKNFESAVRIWIDLFPRQVFGGLKHLKVEGMRFKRFVADVKIRQDWAEKMFPNASLQIS